MPTFFCHQCERTVGVIEGTDNQTLRCGSCDGEFIERVAEGGPLDNSMLDGFEADENMLFSDGDDDGSSDGSVDDLLDEFIMGDGDGNFEPVSPDHMPNENGDMVEDAEMAEDDDMGLDGEDMPTDGEDSQEEEEEGNGGHGVQIGFHIQILNPSNADEAQRGISARRQMEVASDRAGEIITRIMNSIREENNGESGGYPFEDFALTPLTGGSAGDYVTGRGMRELMNQLFAEEEVPERGLSKEEIESLPKIKIEEDEVNAGSQCITCMENFTLSEEVVQLPCKHVFHQDCIVPWLEKQCTCPICRKEMPRAEDKKREITKLTELD